MLKFIFFPSRRVLTLDSRLVFSHTSRYGGPGSQLVSASFEIGWHAYLACDLQYVIVIVDGRGTGYKGRALRNPVKGNLGFWEVRDQLNAAR